VIRVERAKLKSGNIGTVVDSKRQDTVVPVHVDHSTRRGGRCRRDAVDISLAIDVHTLPDAQRPLRGRRAFNAHEAHKGRALKVGRPVSNQDIAWLAERESH